MNQIEKSSFTPMVFTTFGGMGDECRRALQRAAGKIASKRKENYADVMGHISTRIRMCILRTVLMSVRGSSGHLIFKTHSVMQSHLIYIYLTFTNN